jgi:site-specific DNA-methyltransferase (adenine-specific)
VDLPGAGGTRIGCEKNKRRARLMELDPKYVDVIICRRQEFTGQKARHEASGTFEETKAARAVAQAS